MTDRIRKYDVFELMLHSSVNYRHSAMPWSSHNMARMNPMEE